jgi:hypothetical protein
MRIANTTKFIDKDKSAIIDYYDNIITGDITDPLTRRALLECKLYHLPNYYSVSTAIKQRLIINDINKLELELLHTNITVDGLSNKSLCTECEKVKHLVDLDGHIMCIDCWLNLARNLIRLWRSEITWERAPLRYFTLKEDYHQSKRVEGFEWFWDIQTWKEICIYNTSNEFLVELKKLLVNKIIVRQAVVDTFSPKKTFLASVIGCRQCGVQYETDSIWTNPAEGWKDGCCPQCRTPKTINPWHRSLHESISYNECTMCGGTHSEYAMWGMCETCYLAWQDSYLDLKILFDTYLKYGAYACLLIRPQPQWIAYMYYNMPTIYQTVDFVPPDTKKYNLDIKRMVYGIASSV